MGDGERDRARGALLGLACGDAVGTTVEFEPPGSFAPVDDMVGGGPFRLAAGQWTDDTSMALCLAESLVDRGTMDLADQMRRYVLWWKEGYFSSTGRCFDIGTTTRQQLARFVDTGEPVAPVVDPEQAANGSLMRLAPVPGRWWRDVADAADQSADSSRPTHAAPRPVDATRLLGAMTAALIAGAPADDVLAPSFWSLGSLHPEVDAVARGSWRNKEPPAIRGTGYCVDSLEAAIWAVAGADDFAGAVLRAANLGDDADTTAAVAGQLAGARWGLTGIPARWRSLLAMHDRIVSLADALFDAEDQQPATFLHDHVVHAWWVEPGRLLAGEYPGGGDGWSAKLDVLIDTGIRTFVDLTAPADGLRPYDDHLQRAAATRGLDLRRIPRPIPDFDVVPVDVYADTLRLIGDEMATGRPVYVHCWGGVGRTGTVIGCHLRAAGLSPDDAIARLATLRAGTCKADRHTPETDAQRAVIARWS